MAGDDRTTKAERELLACLDDTFTHQRELDPAVLASVRAWQRTDRTYELVQRIAREAPEDTDGPAIGIATVKQHLDLAIRSGRLPFEARVFRGLRSLRMGLGIEYPAHAPGRQIEVPGFCATTVRRAIATREFTTRSGVLLDLMVPAGTPALWVAGVGAPELRRQAELLLPNGISVHAYSLVSRSSLLPVVRGRVIWDE